MFKTYTCHAWPFARDGEAVRVCSKTFQAHLTLSAYTPFRWTKLERCVSRIPPPQPPHTSHTRSPSCDLPAPTHFHLGRRQRSYVHLLYHSSYVDARGYLCVCVCVCGRNTAITRVRDLLFVCRPPCAPFPIYYIPKSLARWKGDITTGHWERTCGKKHSVGLMIVIYFLINI